MATAIMPQVFSLSSVGEEIGHNVPAVAKVLANQYGDFVSVWTMVDDFSRTVRNEIYDAEADLMATYSDMKFDFHVVRSNEHTCILDMKVAYAR